MNFSVENESSAIVGREVEENERLQMLPRHFGRDMLTVEYAIFAFMRKLSAQAELEHQLRAAANRLRRQTCFCQVLGKNFRLRLAYFRKSLFQSLSDIFM